MEPASLRTRLESNRIASLDKDAIYRYNIGASDAFRLRIELGPSAFEGNVDSAPIVLLLANPGFDDTSTAHDHAFSREGWPLSGLNPDAPPGLREWWWARLRTLIELRGAQRVAAKVACLQVTPWASTKFDRTLHLPSRTLMLEAASSCASRGAIMIVMRAESLWLEAAALASSSNRYRVRSWRSSYVTKGNLDPVAWDRVVEAICDD